MRTHRSFLIVVCLSVLCAAFARDLRAQDGAVDQAYIRAVATVHGVPVREAELLTGDRLARDELPVLLKLSRSTGIAATGILAMRGTGIGWAAIARRYQLGSSIFHVEIPENETDATVERAHRMFRESPRSEWDSIDLDDAEIVALTNISLITRVLGVTAGQVLAARRESGSYVEAFGRLSAAR